MICTEQKELADYIKGVHLSLRKQACKIGAEKAWEEHLENKEVLTKYAHSMKQLAEKYWLHNNTSGSGNLCRIQWTVDCVIDYFRNGGVTREAEREIHKTDILIKKHPSLATERPFAVTDTSFKEPLQLLDVGSCYNPFKCFDFLQVYPIDLQPATEDVKKCNFVRVETRTSNSSHWFIDNISQLPVGFFDVVVFSLFLEYLPSKEQRFICCEKASVLLKTHGLLIIITPDSKHASANAWIMKQWKLALARLGLVRIKLEKLQYLYCMVFRKASWKLYPALQCGGSVVNEPSQLMLIPQDHVDYKEEVIAGEAEENIRSNCEQELIASGFNQLPLYGL